MANNFFTICSFFYSLMLCVVYFRRKNIGSLETKTYSCIVISNFLNIILALLCFITIMHMNSLFILNDFVSKTLLLLFITWELFFSFYVFVITRNEEEKNIKEKVKKVKNIIFLLYLVITFCVYFLPLYYHGDNNVIYSYGPAANFIYALTAVLIIIWIIIIIKNYSILKSKKCIPIILFIVMTLVAVIIQKQNPGLLLITATETFITVIMYFTIENPDAKLLTEMHKAKEVTDSANEEKTMFLYNMTNELREITRDIDNEADNILNETDNKKVNIELVNNSAREIKGSTARFTTMTNEILDISTVDATSIKIYNDKYNIKLLIKELVQMYKASSEKKGIDFRTSIASDLPEYLYGDIVGLKNSLSTILDNSLNYTESGYIEFSISAIIKNDIARLIITVEDSGVGMKADELNKIFNKKSEDKEVTDLNENLYNARKLITLMGGTIIPSSIFGKGTIMKVVIDQKIFNSENEFTKYEKIYDKKKILLVDDSPAGVKIVTKMLNGTNIILDVVNSGKECLDKIRAKEKYDLILLDEEMSPINGIEVMVKLKEIRNFNIKTILLTKNNDYEYNEEYLKYGFKDYLLKPLDKDKVLKKIDKYLK